MSRAARLLELLELLRRRRAPVKGEELAERLGVSMRTLYRDIATLQAQGADIRGEPGVGYVLYPGFTLPPLMFTVDELEALTLGSRWVSVRGDPRLSAAADTAVAKIRAVLPQTLRETFDDSPLVVPNVDSSTPVRVDTAAIRTAIRQEKKLSIEYRDGSGNVTQRTVWPILIGYFEKVLLLVAYCESRQDYRTFRVDRIGGLAPTNQPYPERRVHLVREWRRKQGIGATVKN